MALNTLRSPGIQITERDLSQYLDAPIGTGVLVVGFAAKGRDYEPMYITSRSAWLTQFGEPTNEAEKYFFNASMEVINQGGMLYCCKLPYENDSLDKLTVKKYTINPTLIPLSTVADYVDERMAKIMAGDYTEFGLNHGEDFKDILFDAMNLAEQVRNYKIAVDNFSIAIPYIYAPAEWMGQLDIPDNTEDNWLYVPAKFIYDRLSATFDKNSFLYEALQGHSSYEDIELSSMIEAAVDRFGQLSAQTSALQLVSTYYEEFAAIADGNVDTEAFRNACDPSIVGNNLTTIINRYPKFENSPIYKFFKDNESTFNYLNSNIDFTTDCEEFHNLKPWFYCGDNFNLGAYWRAINLYSRIEDAIEASKNIDIANVYNKILDLRDALGTLGSSLSALFDTPIKDTGITMRVDTSDPAAVAALEMALIKPVNLTRPITEFDEAFRKLLASEEFAELVRQAKIGKYYDSALVPFAVDYYLDHTIVSTDDKTTLRKSKNFNDFALSAVGNNGPGSPMSSFFEVYNGPDSASPELSNIEALYNATIAVMSQRELIDFSETFIETAKDPSFEELSAIAYSEDMRGSGLSTVIEKFKTENIETALKYSEIKTADYSMKQYIQISSNADVSLMDLETVDGYATGETPVTPNTIVIVDKTRGTLGTAYAKAEDGTQKETVGIIPIITTAANALYIQALLDTGDTGIDEYNAVAGAETLGGANIGPFTIDDANAAIPWASTKGTDYTVSRFIAGNFPSIHFTDEGTFDRQFMKMIGVVVLRAYLDPGEGNKINYDVVESFAGELDKDAVDPNTGATTFIDTLINNQSEYIEFYSNCFNDEGSKKAYSKMDLLVIPPQKAGNLGFYQYMTKKDISLAGSITKPLQLIWEKNEDINEKQLDIVVDAGVSNIAQFIKSVFNGGKGEYDPNSEFGSLFKLRSREDTKTWRDILGMYDNFCKNIRKDCMFVADGPRPFCLTGNKKIVRTSKPKNTIDGNILPMLKYITGINSNYGAGYCDWFQVSDEFSGDYFWCPPSIKAMGVYLNTDINYDYWMAPAGLNRGVVPALDVAFSPTQRQADEIYPKSWNYARSYPNDGIVLEGQKTFQTKNSSLDRVAARRALLRFERIAYELARWFLYETNDVLTRQRFYDALNGAYAEIKARGGMYDYKIVCDETVNTDEVIERNEFRCKVGVKLNKFMEFIYIEFNVMKRSASWTEML